jgi:small subunit ribosomal protein S16
MALSMRLSRGGSKKRPYYKIVVADARAPRDGKFIERIGSYNPQLPKDSAERMILDAERAKHWLAAGAQPSDRVARFLDIAGVKERKVKSNPSKGEPGQKAKDRAEDKATKLAEAEEAAAAAAAAPAPEPEPEVVEEVAAEEVAPAVEEASAAEEAAPVEAVAEEAPAAEEATSEAVLSGEAPVDGVSAEAPVEGAVEPAAEEAQVESASAPAEGADDAAPVEEATEEKAEG